jgi:hypothetical protein
MLIHKRLKTLIAKLKLSQLEIADAFNNGQPFCQ